MKDLSDLNERLNVVSVGILHNLEIFREKIKTLIDSIVDVNKAFETDDRLQFLMAGIIVLYAPASMMEEKTKNGTFKVSEIIDLYNKFEIEFCEKEIKK